MSSTSSAAPTKSDNTPSLSLPRVGMPIAAGPARLRILLDCDGVLSDFVGGVCRELAVGGYARRSPEAFTHYDMARDLASDEQSFFRQLARRPGFCRSLDWLPGALDFARALRVDHEVSVITAPWEAESWEGERRQWLRPVFAAHEVASVPAALKPRVRGDVLIEDCADTLTAWLRENPRGAGILIRRPWNALAPRSSPWIHIAHDYRDAIELVNTLAGRCAA